MMKFSRLLIMFSFLLVGASHETFTAEHSSAVVNEIVRFGENKLFQDEIARAISKGVEEGVKVGVKKGIEESLSQDSGISWGTVIKVGVATTIIGGGGFFLGKWLRKKWATPQDLEKKDARVTKHMTSKREALKRHVNDTFESVEQEVKEVDLEAEQLSRDVGVVNEDVRRIFNGQSQYVSGLFLGFKAGTEKHRKQSVLWHGAVVDGVGLASLVLDDELSQLNGIHRASEGVEQLRKDMTAHSERMDKALNLQRELQQREHTELLSDVESLAKEVPEVKKLVTQNGQDLQEILKGIQELREADEKHDTRLEEFGRKHDELLRIITEREKEQKSVISHLEGMHNQLDLLIGTLLVMPTSEEKLVSRKRMRGKGGSILPVIKECTCDGGPSCRCLTN